MVVVAVAAKMVKKDNATLSAKVALGAAANVGGVVWLIGGGGGTVLVLERIVLPLAKSVGVVVLLLNGWRIVGTLVKLLSLKTVEVAVAAVAALFDKDVVKAALEGASVLILDTLCT